MQIRYFDTAWNDVKNSPGWLGKICLLALIDLVPVLGSMIKYGYQYSWAREISWGAHRPMPEKLICNEDGKFWRRGWFIFVLLLVFGLIPTILIIASQSMQMTSTYAAQTHGEMSVISGLGSLIYFVGIALALLVSILGWIGSMRISIYDRLSAGFQFSKLWKMLRKDTGGIMRVFGMYLLISLIVGFVVSIVFVMLMMIVVFVGAAGVMSSGYTISSAQYLTDAQAMELLMRFTAAAGPVGIICLTVSAFLFSACSVFAETLAVRAIGYWTSQFDVPHWRGQDDPMPFELVQATTQPNAQTAPMGQPPYQQSGTQQGFPVQQPGVQSGFPEQQPYQQANVQPQTGWQSGQSTQQPYAQPGAWQGQAGVQPGLQQSQSAAPQSSFAVGVPAASAAQQPGEAVVGSEIVDKAIQSVQEAQDAAMASPEVQAYEAQMAAWKDEDYGVQDDQ